MCTIITPLPRQTPEFSPPKRGTLHAIQGTMRIDKDLKTFDPEGRFGGLGIPAMKLIKQRTKYENGIETQASILETSPGLHKVTVIHRFDSGNFLTEKPQENLSLVAALGVVEFYTR